MVNKLKMLAIYFILHDSQAQYKKSAVRLVGAEPARPTGIRNPKTNASSLKSRSGHREHVLSVVRGTRATTLQ